MLITFRTRIWIKLFKVKKINRKQQEMLGNCYTVPSEWCSGWLDGHRLFTRPTDSDYSCHLCATMKFLRHHYMTAISMLQCYVT